MGLNKVRSGHSTKQNIDPIVDNSFIPVPIILAELETFQNRCVCLLRNLVLVVTKIFVYLIWFWSLKTLCTSLFGCLNVKPLLILACAGCQSILGTLLFHIRLLSSKLHLFMQNRIISKVNINIMRADQLFNMWQDAMCSTLYILIL